MIKNILAHKYKFLLFTFFLISTIAFGLYIKWRYDNRILVYPEVAKFDATNLLTYHNEEYGFEFQYPTDWIVKEESKPFAKFALGIYGPLADYSPLMKGYKVPSFSAGLYITTSDEAKSDAQNYLSRRGTATEINVGGTVGTKYEFKPSGDSDSLSVTILLPLKDDFLHLGMTKEAYEGFTPALATFKFSK